MDEFLKFFDAYNRVARLYPAMITLAPVVWTASAFAPATLDLEPASTALAGLIATALLYALASFARSRGKVLEPKLLSMWGGWVTTLLLRHRDDGLDAHTKTRYHAALARLCEPLSWPSEADESQDPAAADKVYRSATLRLIEHRRDSRFKLLHRENASYGFRRNLLGLKSMALGFLAICTIAVIVAWAFGGEYVQIALTDAILVLGANTACAGFWLWLVTPAYVRQAAAEYAVALFRTLEGDSPSDPTAVLARP